MSDSTLSYSPSQDGKHTETPDFASCPPIFVLSTHLTLDELQRVEDMLGNRGARLTYDVSEARLVLGRVSQKKRAALELRSKGVWTEEVDVPSVSRDESSPEPAVKRRRVQGSTTHAEKVDLSTESEGEEDGVKTQHDPGKHLRRRRSVSVTSSNSATGSSKQQPTDIIKVVKLEWLEKSLEARELVSTDPFLVYHARISENPTPTKTASTTAAANVIQRAREDEMFKKPAGVHPGQLTNRRSRVPHNWASSQHPPPPKLYRQTTSEHDEDVPLPPVPDWVKNRVMYACMRSAPLHPPNARFIEQLVKIRKTRELNLDEIGVRAYSTSIASIAAYPYELRRPSDILMLPGCDAKISNLFAEFQQSENGTIQAAEILTTDPDLKILHHLNNIWGVGAKTARDFYYARQWRDLDDIVEYGWDSLSRVQQIGVKYYDEFLDGVARAETESIAQTIHRHANTVRPNADYDGRGVECVIVGGYRRGKQVSADVDLILSHRDESFTKNLVIDLVSSLEAEGWITHTLSLHMTTSNRDQQTLPYRGDDESVPGRHFDSLDKALVVWQDPQFDDNGDQTSPPSTSTSTSKRKRNPNPHRRVDIIISPWRTVGCAVLGWSGDTTFERDLRRYAKKAHGWKFDSSGVRMRADGGRGLDLEGEGRTWEERERLVMEALGIGYRRPEERCSR